ncbi:hypothetical protein V2J09_006586 [Rumex salicifolius]
MKIIELSYWLPFFFLFLFFVCRRKLIVSRLRSWCCCDCHVCRAYVTSSWANEYPNLSDWYTHLLRRSPTKTVRLHVLGNAVFTANPDTVEYILKTRFDNYPKGKPFSDILGDFLGAGIFNVDGDPWRFQRRIASRELDSASVRSFAFEVVGDEIRRRLIPFLSSVADTCSDAVLDLQEVFRRFSFDCICKFSLGIDPADCFLNDDGDLSLYYRDFAAAFDTVTQLSAERALHVFPFIWKLKRALNLGSERRLNSSLHVINTLSSHVIIQRRRTASSHRTDLLSRFMSVTDDDAYLREIIISFILAGRDSVASALTALFLLISAHPAVEAAILREAEAVLDPSTDDVAPNFEQIRRLNYLQAAVYETMRLYPPVQFDSKFCKNDDVLPDGTKVAKGTRVTYHTYAMGRMEEIWGKDCLEFKPERWLKKNKRNDVVSFWFSCESAYKYPVFQAGVRVCLGKELAIMQIKIVALSLFRRFRFPVAGGGGVPRFSPGLTATLHGGLPVMVVHRRDDTN